MAAGQFFSQRFSYSVHALAYMARKPDGELTTLPELAAWMHSIWAGASDSYLSNVIQRLARGGLVRSVRGVAGGYALAREPADITLRDVFEILENVNLDRCSLSAEDECRVQGSCDIQLRLRTLEESHLNAMAQINIAQLAPDITLDPPQLAAPAGDAPMADGPIDDSPVDETPAADG